MMEELKKLFQFLDHLESPRKEMVLILLGFWVKQFIVMFPLLET